MNGIEDTRRVARTVAAEAALIGVTIPDRRRHNVIKHYEIMESHAVWVMAVALLGNADETTPILDS